MNPLRPVCPAHLHQRRQLLLACACAGLSACASPDSSGLPSPAAAASPYPQPPEARLLGTVQHDLTDPASGRTWRVWAQWPKGPTPPGGHPLLCVLDGNATFAIAAQMARNDEGRPAAMKRDSVVVIGIGHPADSPYSPPLRQRDYTPASTGRALASDSVGESGGAAALRGFIARVVLPWANRTVRTDPARHTLFGHSLAGLFTLDTLFSPGHPFTRFAAASPSIWWNNGQLLQTAGHFIKLQRGSSTPRVRLQLRIGALEVPEAATTPERATAQRDRRMQENLRTLAAMVDGAGWPGIGTDLAIYPGLDHGDVLVPALIDALSLARQP